VHEPAKDPRVPALSPSAAGADRSPPPGIVGRRTFLFVAAVLLAAVAGIAVVHFPPLLVIGLAGAALFGLVVLSRPFWGLLIYTAVFLLRPAELYPVLAPLHLERVVGAAALLSMLASQYFSRGHLFVDRSSQTLWLALFLIPVSLAVPFAYWPSQAAGGLFSLLKLIVFYILIGHLVDSRRRLHVFVFVVCLLTLYLAGSAFAAYLRGGAGYAQGIDRAVGETSAAGNPNSLGTTAAASFPLFLLFALHRPFGRWRALFALSAVVLLVTLAVTGSRASLLGFLGGLACLWWLARRRALVGIVGLLLLGAGFLVLPAQYRERYSTITQSELDASSRERLATWKAGMRMIIDRPLLGVGLGCFGTAHATDYSPESKRSWLRAHSLYVQVPAEVGLTGAAVFFGFLFVFMRTNRRIARELLRRGASWRFEKILMDAIFAGCVVLLISGLFGHSLLRVTWYLFAALGLSVLRRLRAEEHPPGRAEGSGATSGAVNPVPVTPGP